MSIAVAVVLFVAITVYAVFGGADFGAGFWDLIAGGTERGAAPRQLIDRSIGPVWEGNHVWLIFTFVVLWTSFPLAYASIWLTLFVPLTIAAVGIVLRGSSFAFRKAVFRDGDRRAFGAIFAISSLLVPYSLGTVVGAIASGQVPADGQAGDPVHSWINPTSILAGVLALAVVAFLAAVYLVWDAARFRDEALIEYFRRRAVVAAVVAGLVAICGLFFLKNNAPYVYAGLTSRALIPALASVLSGVGALAALLRRNHRGARLLAITAVSLTIVSWGVAQWDYVLPETMTVAQAASPAGTLATVLVVAVVAALVIIPAFGLLYVLDQWGLLPGEGVEGGEADAHSASRTGGAHE